MTRLRSLFTHATRWVPAVMLLAGVAVLAGVPLRSAATYEGRTAVGEAWQQNGFAIAVVWPRRDRPEFVEGAQLAWEEIDRGTGPLAGKIRLRVYTEPTTQDEGGLAQQVANADDVMVVLGHAIPEHVVPASLVYERHAIVFLSPQATDPRSTNHQFQYVFRLTPDDEAIADVLARFAATRGWTRVGVLYPRTDHGESASRAFTARATAHGLRPVFQRSYHPGHGDWRKHDFRPLAAEIRAFEFDAVLVADALPAGAKLVRDLVQLGVTQPILGTDKLEPSGLIEIAGQAARNVHVATAFDPSSPTTDYVTFRNRFVQRYREEPGYAAAQGYEAFRLAARAGQLSRSAAPLVLATTIRLAPSWDGLFGAFKFRYEGDILGRPIAIAHLQDGRPQTEFTWKGTSE